MNPKTEVGARVMAILSAKDGVVYVMGEGTYLGMEVPEKCGIPGIDRFAELKIPNPTIKLDNGTKVYGMECWWGEIDKVRGKFSGMKFETVPLQRYRPWDVVVDMKYEDDEIQSL